MNWSVFFSQALSATNHFDYKIALILFALCCLGEIWFGIPYILETVWLLAGYNLVHHSLSPIDLLLIWLVAQAGRQTGSLILFYSSKLGIAPLKKLWKRFVEPRLPKKSYVPSSITKHLTNPSPFSVAIGRLVGLRLPMLLATSAKNNLVNLVLGVILSSLVWDGIYIIIGITVGNVVKTEWIVLYSVVGLTVLYISILFIRHQVQKRSAKNKDASGRPGTA
jgi:membrane protein DedA with SNARE-associated domain